MDYKKQLTPKSYGVESLKDLVFLVRDTVYVDDKNLLQSMLVEEMECQQVFVKLTEEVRRDRCMRIDLGEANARLNLKVQGNNSWSDKQGGWNQGQQNGQKGWGNQQQNGNNWPQKDQSANKGGAPLWQPAQKRAW